MAIDIDSACATCARLQERVDGLLEENKWLRESLDHVTADRDKYRLLVVALAERCAGWFEERRAEA